MKKEGGRQGEEGEGVNTHPIGAVFAEESEPEHNLNISVDDDMIDF